MANETIVTNGTAKFWGVPLDKWLSTFQTIGIPTAFMIFVMYIAWCQIPPLVEGHVKLLERTGDTLESMDEALRQSNAILLEVNDTGKKTRLFMEMVVKDHQHFADGLDINGKKIDANSSKLDTLIKTKP
jgi:hypothetical protein